MASHLQLVVMGGLLIVETVFFPRFLTRAAFGCLRYQDQLRHSLQVIGTLSLPHGEGRAVQARGGRRSGAEWAAGGAGAGGSTGGGQVPGWSRGAKLARTRLGGGARLRVCSARAPQRVCVSPLSPSFPAGPSARRSG